MYVLIRYPVGIIVEGVVLARGRNRLRVAVSGLPDTIELRRSGQKWVTEAREQVEFDFLLSKAHADESVSSSKPAAMVGAAGLVAIQ
jgi:hypothetical protein